ncbi:MAG TPA: VOC family protein [Candidatus Binataceae bacterium]|nr:VOC family protein [Candidatus Binataceae bacterium]
MSRPRIRHLALFSRNPKQLADFYEKVFEMEVIRNEDNRAIYLSDGYLTLAILPHRLETEAAVGLNHFGFEIEDTEQMCDRLVAAGVERPKRRPATRPYAEHRACDPEGNQFDLSEHGFQRAETWTDRAQPGAQPESTADKPSGPLS